MKKLIALSFVCILLSACGHVTGDGEKVGTIIKLSKARKKLKTSTFGLPGERKYPMPDKSHAANAKARATQMVKKGKLSAASKAKIDVKANEIVRKSK